MNILTVNHKSLSYLIQFKKIKHLYFRIKDNYVLVTANKNISFEKIKIHLMNNFDKYYELIAKNQEASIDFYLWGKKYLVSINDNSTDFSYYINDCYINLSYNKKTNDVSSSKRLIYYQELRKTLELIEDEINTNIKKIGITPLNIKIKYLKSKFGSYHRIKNEITLNSILACYDPIYLKYVLYHEYAHTIEFNHSKRFYKVLDMLMDNHKLIQKSLKKQIVVNL